MKTRLWSLGLLFGMTLVILSACSTTKVDWDSRVGVLTRDEAVLELGPPERESELTDGTKVGEWLVNRVRSPDYVVGTGRYYGWRSGWGGYVAGGNTYETYLRLTFGSEGKLKAWKKVTR